MVAVAVGVGVGVVVVVVVVVVAVAVAVAVAVVVVVVVVVVIVLAAVVVVSRIPIDPTMATHNILEVKSLPTPTDVGYVHMILRFKYGGFTQLYEPFRT